MKLYLFLAAACQWIPDCLFLLEALRQPQEQSYSGQGLHRRYFPPVNNTHIRLVLFLIKQTYFVIKCQQPPDHSNWMTDLEFCREVLWWHLDVATFRTLGGVQTEMGGQRALVGQGDGPWNSLAHHVQAKVNELALNFQLVWRSHSKHKN